MYARTGGGVTLSGGEATAQFDFCLELLEKLNAAQIHTCLDTCGQCEPMHFARLCAAASMVLYDIKHTDPDRHRALTGVSNRLILANFALLGKMRVPVEVRIPVTVSYTHLDVYKRQGLRLHACPAAADLPG